MEELQTVWGTLPALYLFLAGAAAGTFFASAMLEVANPKCYGRIASVGFASALVLLAVGLLCLVAETEKPWRAMLLPLSFTNTSSWMTIGAWLLLAAFVVYAVAGALSVPRVRVRLGDRANATLRALSVAGAVLSVGVAAYSAALLMAAPAVPLWSSPTLVSVFLASAASMGVAIVSVIVRWAASRAEEGSAGEPEPLALRIALVAAPVVELCAVAAFLYATFAGTSTQQRSFDLITTGSLAAQFWVGAIAIGIVAPAIVAIAEAAAAAIRKRSTAARRAPRSASRIAAAISCACSLAGAFCLRSVIVAAGVHASLVIPIPFP